MLYSRSLVLRMHNQVGEAVVAAVAVVRQGVPVEAVQDRAEQVVGPHRLERRPEARGPLVEERLPGRPYLIPR